MMDTGTHAHTHPLGQAHLGKSYPFLEHLTPYEPFVLRYAVKTSFNKLNSASYCFVLKFSPVKPRAQFYLNGSP